VQQFPIDSNVIAFRIGLRSQLGDRLSVDGNAAGGDQFFGFAARSNTRSCDNFLKTFDWHD